MSRVRVSEDLDLTIGKSTARLTTSEALSLAERLARASFRRAAIEEAAAVAREGRSS